MLPSDESRIESPMDGSKTRSSSPKRGSTHGRKRAGPCKFPGQAYRSLDLPAQHQWHLTDHDIRQMKPKGRPDEPQRQTSSPCCRHILLPERARAPDRPKPIRPGRSLSTSSQALGRPPPQPQRERSQPDPWKWRWKATQSSDSNACPQPFR